jgi:hypothetical protein
MKKLHIVVSRYNEDISWVSKIENITFDIFNKGSDYIKNSKIIPNVGREAHTYLYYIIENYDNLPEYVCFLQGNPFDHSQNMIFNINNFINCDTEVDFMYISENLIKCDINGSPHHPGLPIGDVCRFLNKEVKDDLIEFGAGAQFIVSKKFILNNEIDFYKKSISIVDQNIRPLGAYVFERLWGFIFNR